ncbi:S-adenosyl-L-methionine-dependent methyltransferase [Schizopora paradoxa]|uniref:S-adenosyl-L-methionine-dependent methyltransferase n=1 Tax=Schizopora paradoxa TaxID=27342 RepID=A0A0H2RQL9_9AGAM|nr:S-adenosyl-L-methionine-dependent methyltransferase [Schizopora paradoxa]
MTSLTTLAQLILKNCEALDASCVARGIAVPSLDDLAYTPGSDVANHDPAVGEAIRTVTNAALQLLSTVRPTPLVLYSLALGGTVSAAAHVAAELHVAEALKESGEKGLHINDIAAKCKTDPLKLAPILRLLASHWVFKEVTPDVFANNRMSSLLDKGQSVEELQKYPESKYSKPSAGMAAGINHFGDETLKLSAHLYEALSDPDWTFSSASNKCAANKAFNTDLTLWKFYEQPEQRERYDRFKIMMASAEKFQAPDLISKSFDWMSLPKDAVVVDVGGGMGNISMLIAKANPELKVVCQDLPETIETGKGRWNGKEREGEASMIAAGRVSLQAYDFFSAQPIKNASVYFLKHVLHDWSDAASLEILRNIRAAAGPDTKLVVMDKVLPYTCLVSEDTDTTEVPGYMRPTLPAPLTNVGAASAGFPYTAAMQMLMIGNGQERTINHFVRLLKEAGWKLECVRQSDALAQNPSSLTAVPIPI